MVDADVVAVKLAEIADRLERVRLHRPDDAEGLTSDRDALELVSFTTFRLPLFGGTYPGDPGCSRRRQPRDRGRGLARRGDVGRVVRAAPRAPGHLRGNARRYPPRRQAAQHIGPHVLERRSRQGPCRRHLRVGGTGAVRRGSRDLGTESRCRRRGRGLTETMSINVRVPQE